MAGGTGFVGRHLIDHFTAKDDEIFVLTRNPDRYQDEPNVKYIQWLSKDSHPEIELHNIDAVINLAGESLNVGRWNEERKKQILDSRITTTREVIRIMGALGETPRVYINASAIGYYGTSHEEIFTEDTVNPGEDFLAEVCSVWETEVDEAKQLGVRTVKARFGVILDASYGALPKIALPYKLMVGGKLGSGQQWLSWVHILDVVRMIDFIIEQSSIKGPVNLTTPNPKRNKDFGKTLGQVLNKPHWLPAPALAIRSVLGEMSDLILKGQYVYPKKLETSGYEFQFPELQSALEDLYQ